MAVLVKGGVALLKARGNPSGGAEGASSNNFAEASVHAAFPGRIGEGAAGTVGDVKIAREDDSPRVGIIKSTIPTLGGIHRKKALSVIKEQGFRWNQSCHWQVGAYSREVKRLSLFLLAVAGIWLSGCTIAEKDISEVGDQIQQGLRGGGRIVERDPTNDSFGPEYR